MKHSLLNKALWLRSDQFHPKLWDWDEYGLGRYYRIDRKYKQIRKPSQYKFKEHRHRHLSNN